MSFRNISIPLKFKDISNKTRPQLQVPTLSKQAAGGVLKIKLKSSIEIDMFKKTFCSTHGKFFLLSASICFS